MRKIKICGAVFIGVLLSFMYSCLGGSNDLNDWEMGNAQIGVFSLESELMPGLSEVIFTIDQINGLIYNKDSMPHDTPTGHKAMVTISFDCPFGIGRILFIEQATGDTLQNVSDSINFAQPVLIEVTAYDGLTTKIYEAKLNIHQTNPDTMIWEKYADILPGRAFQDMKTLMFQDSCYLYAIENSVCQLFTSDMEDLINWEQLTLSGFPNDALIMQMTLFQDELNVITESGHLYYSSDGKEWTQAAVDVSIKSLLGYLPRNIISGRNDVICCIAEIDGVLRFVTIDKQLSCIVGQPVPETFPLSGFNQFNYEYFYYPRLVVATGRDSKNEPTDMAWASMDGISWAALSSNDKKFSKREGSSVFFYDQCFFVVGGIQYYGATKDISFSIDQGITWFEEFYVYNSELLDYELESYYSMPEEFVARAYASVIVDKDNYMLLFGGKATNNANVMNEIWRGRINRLGFGKSR